MPQPQHIPKFQDPVMQLSRLASEYVQYLASPLKGFSPKTTESYDLTYRQFVAYLLGQGQIDDVRNFTPDNVEGFITYLSGVGISGNSINVKLAALSSLGKRAMKVKNGKGYVADVNPVDRVERPQKTRPVRKFLHREEIDLMLRVEAPEHELLARDLFFDLGSRVSEIANANVEDLQITQDERYVLATSVKGRGRSQEKVHDVISKTVGDRLVAHIREREARGKDPLLVNREGRRYTRTTLSEMIMRMGRKAGITRMTVRPHSIRHTYNVIADEAGVDSTMRSNMLHHSDPATIRSYDHASARRTAAARELVRAVLRG